MPQSGAVHDMDLIGVLSTNSFSPCVEGTVTHTLMRSRNTMETRPGALLHTDVTEMNTSSVSGPKYFVTFIYEASGLVSTCHVKIKEKAAKLLTRDVRCVERQTDFPVKKIVLASGKEYIMGTKKLKAMELRSALPQAVHQGEWTGGADEPNGHERRLDQVSTFGCTCDFMGGTSVCSLRCAQLRRLSGTLEHTRSIFSRCEPQLCKYPTIRVQSLG